MSFAVFPSGPFQTNAYVLFCPKTLQSVIIDPAPQSKKAISAYISTHALIPQEIWLTHSHWDHMGDLKNLMQEYTLEVAVHSEDALNVQEPGSDQLPCWIDIEGVTPTHFLKDNEEISVGELIVRVIFTPGHTPGGVCFYLPKEHLLFSGDTLFQGTIGNLSFPTARPALMWHSLAKLAKLPSNTRVLPGHGPETTIGQESWLERAEQLFGNSANK